MEVFAMPVQTLDQKTALSQTASWPVMLFSIAIMFALYAFMFWAMFEKAGWPGWASLIPIYNVYVLLKIAGMSGWWLLAFLVPILDIVVGIMMLWKISKAFGHGAGYFFGLLFLSIIFFPMLGFGKSEYMLEKHHMGHETSGAMPTPA
jgi:hypothetical protein